MSGSAFFEDLATPKARMITTDVPPDLDELNPGDMVICTTDWGMESYIDEARERGIHIRHGRYRYQQERIVSRTAKLRSTSHAYTPLSGRIGEPPGYVDKDSVTYATDAFAQTWDALTTELTTHPTYEAAADYAPTTWLPYLPFPTLNPAQAQAAPHITGSHNSLVITAPTGAGKTVMGMLAALKTILDEGKKAAWLVPQRSLTSELDRELDSWRKQGLKVVALSGETATDTTRTKEADLWVATTEKFEALCRSSSMRDTISEIGTIIVDEIHLLGDPSRGSVLESLLARVLTEKLPVRIIGLSATAANAAALADWLKADLVPIAWRPTRQTSQMLTIPNDSVQMDSRYRHRVCAEIVADITRDNGSVVIFCGTKAHVRATALAVARSRGVDTSRVDATDIEAIYAATAQAGVGLHYSDWPHKAEAERAFREQRSDVLVATSTLAAGVNLPARGVIVSETTIGQNLMEVSMVQQMFGRAGRAGKEAEGWSFLIGNSNEVSIWRKRLNEGYSIRSGLARVLDDHLLGEIVQQNVGSFSEATRWWEHTFAHHEGESGTKALIEARERLTQFGFIEVDDSGANAADPTIIATRLGLVTSRMMVSVKDAAGLIMAFGGKDAPPTPKGLDPAERLLVSLVAARVSALANAPSANGDQAPHVRRILDANGRMDSLGPLRTRDRNDTLKGQAVSEAGLLLALRSPAAFTKRGGQVLGVNRAMFNPALYDSTRIFAWLSAVGPLRAVPPWVSAVALDVGARIDWYMLHPSRGDGRVLAACERAVPRASARKLVPALFKEVRNAGVTAPDLLARVQAPAGVSHARLQEVAVNSVAYRGGVFSKGATAYVASDARAWVPLKAGDKPGRRLAIAFHPSGDSHGNEWLESRI